MTENKTREQLIAAERKKLEDLYKAIAAHEQKQALIMSRNPFRLKFTKK